MWIKKIKEMKNCDYIALCADTRFLIVRRNKKNK